MEQSQKFNQKIQVSNDDPFMYFQYKFHPFLNQEIICVKNKNISYRLGANLDDSKIKRYDFIITDQSQINKTPIVINIQLDQSRKEPIKIGKGDEQTEMDLQFLNCKITEQISRFHCQLQQVLLENSNYGFHLFDAMSSYGTLIRLNPSKNYEIMKGSFFRIQNKVFHIEDINDCQMVLNVLEPRVQTETIKYDFSENQEFLIGRNKQNQYVYENERVAMFHAIIRCKSIQNSQVKYIFYMNDLNSNNGTWFSKFPLKTPIENQEPWVIENESEFMVFPFSFKLIIPFK